MRTPANIAKHPIHPMLIPIPIGLWIFSLVCDLIHAAGSADPAWPTVALYTMGGGIVGALAAALPGLIDLLSLPPEPRRTAIMHMVINLMVVALYVINFWMRLNHSVDLKVPLGLSIIGIGLLVISGWLGGKMVYVHGVAVDPGANVTPPGRR
jgi:uncharacterized membrane protein